MSTFLTVLDSAWSGLLVMGLMCMILPWAPREGWFRVIVITPVILLTIRYATWRLTATIPPVEETVNWLAGSLFFAIEVVTIIGLILSLLTLMRSRSRSSDVDRKLKSTNRVAPLVDVFICTYNEEREILERTIVGANAIDYPNYRVWVLDDGRRDWLQSLAEEFGCNYLTRPDNAHAKAGNINHALAHVAGLSQKPDFISILDADFVPARTFLKRTLVLFDEDDIGIVQTPQHFVNPDPIQSNLGIANYWPDEQRYFFEVVMPAKDAWGQAFCCGTSSVIRAKALYEIGGFPTYSVTEDYLLTLCMKKQGYKTIYLNERLSMGLAPEGLGEYVTQRSRWCLGFIQIFRSKMGPFKLGNGLTFLDRFSLFDTFLYWSACYLFRVAVLLVPVLYLLFGIQAVDVDVAEGVAYFLPYYVANIAVIAWLSERRVLPILTDLSQLLALREILAAVFIGLVRPCGHRFKVTAKGGDRSKTVVQWRMMAVYIALLLLTFWSILYAFIFEVQRALDGSSAIALFWCWYNAIVLTLAILACIEQPRVRGQERLRAEHSAALFYGEKIAEYTIVDISTSGIRFSGAPIAELGAQVQIALGEYHVSGRVVRQSTTDFAVQLHNSPDSLTTMISHVYSGDYYSGVGEISAVQVTRFVANRIFS